MIPKDFNGFMGTLKRACPDENWPETLRAMWFDARGNWEASHTVAQDIHNDIGSWIHAYLHRKEGDDFNAGYWYGRARKPFPTLTLKEEFEQIVNVILTAYGH